METVHDIIIDAQNRVKKLKGAVQFEIAKPQKLADVEAFEKKFKIRLPEDYKTFIVEHGLLTTKLGKGYKGTYGDMFDIKKVAKIANEAEEYMMFLEGDPKALIPFQYCVDSKTGSFYHFTVDEVSRKLDMRRLKYENQYKVRPSKDFTEHMQNFVNFVISWQCE